MNDTIRPQSVRYEDFENMNVACVRHIGPYARICEAFDTLEKWALENKLLNPSSTVFAIYLDMADTVSADKLRSDACLTVPHGTIGGAPVEIRELPTGGRYALGRFDFTGKENFPKAWAAMYTAWLPESGHAYDPTRPALEIYRNDCSNNRYIVDICLPVS
jgi:AraC family transcriptional regulator